MSSDAMIHLQAFIEHIRRHSSSKTADNYSFYLKRFLSLTKTKAVVDISNDIVGQFRDKLRSTRNQRGALLGSATINYHLIALRAFLEFLQSQSIISLDPKTVQLEKVSQKKRAQLGKKDIEKLLAAPHRKKNSEIISLRDRALLEVLLCTGLKVSEISQLTRSGFEKSHTVLAVRGLRNTTRTVMLSNHARHWVKRYVAARADTAAPLFIRHDKANKSEARALTPRSIQRTIEKYSRAAELPPRVSPETLRQHYARTLAVKGYNTKSIKQSLGHASAITTRRYTKN